VSIIIGKREDFHVVTGVAEYRVLNPHFLIIISHIAKILKCLHLCTLKANLLAPHPSTSSSTLFSGNIKPDYLSYFFKMFAQQSLLCRAQVFQERTFTTSLRVNGIQSRKINAEFNCDIEGQIHELRQIPVQRLLLISVSITETRE
jgi:hypothetical protein